MGCHLYVKFKENDQYKKKTEIMDPVITLNGKNVTPRPLFDSSKSSCENKLAFSSVTFDDILQHTSLCSVEQNIFPWILDRKDEDQEPYPEINDQALTYESQEEFVGAFEVQLQESKTNMLFHLSGCVISNDIAEYNVVRDQNKIYVFNMNDPTYHRKHRSVQTFPCTSRVSIFFL